LKFLVDDCHQKRPGTAGDKKYLGQKKHSTKNKNEKNVCETASIYDLAVCPKILEAFLLQEKPGRVLQLQLPNRNSVIAINTG
jgi:hypothetical protein